LEDLFHVIFLACVGFFTKKMIWDP
jgi:hypothetical protein